MITKTLIGIAAVLYAMAASAQTGMSPPQSRKSPPNPAQIIERLKAALPAVKCATGAVTDADTTMYTLASGASYEFAHAEGRITSVTAIAPGGQRMKVDAAPVSRAVAATARSDQGEARAKAQAMAPATRAQVQLAMEKFLRAECARFAAGEAGEAPAEEQLVVGGAAAAGAFRPGDWDYADFLGFSDFFSRDAFESSASNGQLRRVQRPQPAVAAALHRGDQGVQRLCGAVGQLEYSGCGGLALAAGFTLGPPTGAAVGYCTGSVYLAAEQCRARCQTPAVVCSWN
jgi:hypothetical protein